MRLYSIAASLMVCSAHIPSAEAPRCVAKAAAAKVMETTHQHVPLTAGSAK